MAAPKGNKFWESRSKHGRDGIWTDPQDLWKDCVGYFEWVEANPLWENKVAQFQGAPVDMPVAKMRAMTLDGLCIHLGISIKTWKLYREREDFIPVVEKTEQIIRDYKFSGAAADLLNANIIARDLGLADKKEVDAKVNLSADKLTDEELERIATSSS